MRPPTSVSAHSNSRTLAPLFSLPDASNRHAVKSPDGPAPTITMLVMLPPQSNDAQGNRRECGRPHPHLASSVFLAERTLGGRDAAFQPLVRRHRLAQRAREPLEAGLHDVVAVLAVQILDVQGDAGVLRKGLEP